MATRSVRETFIRAHIEHLPAHRLLRVPPHRDESERSILPGPVSTAARLAAQAVRRDPDETENALCSRLPQRGKARLYARHLRRAGVDVVLAEFGYEAVELHAGCRLAGVPLVPHFHGYDAFQNDIVEHYGARYEALFRERWPVVAVSESMRRQLIGLGAEPEQVVVNPYGVDLASFEASAPEPGLVLSVGRLVEKKAPDLTVLAFAEALTQAPDARLVMIGDGPLRPVVEEVVATRGLQARVRLLGECDHATVAAHLRRASVFAQHSVIAANGDREGTPVAIIEAGAAGVPVVATRHEGIREVVADGETGILVEERDVSGMGRALGRLLSNRDEAVRMGVAAQQRIRVRYSLDASIERLREILEDAARSAD